MEEIWSESAALAKIRRTFEYAELRRDPERPEPPTPGEKDAMRQIQQAFEAQDMRALRAATRRYLREAPISEPKES